MTNLLNWLNDNKTWVFSGIGVLFISYLINVIFLRNKKNNKQKIIRQKAKHAEGVYQAGRDIHMHEREKDHRPSLKVLVHRGYFIGNSIEHFFIKVVNVSSETNVVVTHVWYEGSQRVDILSAKLPVKLGITDIWETYIQSSSVPNDTDLFHGFHVLISTGEIFTSEKNETVPPVGYIAGQ